MDRNFARALSLVLKHEGGFVNHPSDPGGATNKGITIGTFRRYVNRNGTVDNLKRISDAEVAKVYRRQYWDKVRGDDLPDGIDYAVFDFAVNSGPSRAAKYLQGVLGVTQDGVIGPQTIASSHMAKPSIVINGLCDQRMAFLRRLAHWPAFGKGWTNRVTDVRSAALSMVRSTNETPARDPLPGAPVPDGQGGSRTLIDLVAALFRAIFKR